MLRYSLNHTILFLRSPPGTGLLTLLVSVLLFVLQPQPWPAGIRVMLALLPSLIPAVLAAVAVKYRDRIHLAKPRLFLAASALFLWTAVLLDAGQTFLPWVLIFSLAVILSVFAGPRYTALLSLGMIFFVVIYGSLRLHQAEQLLYLNLLVRQEQRKAAVELSVKEENGRLLLFETGAAEPLLSAPRPAELQRLKDAESDGFFGLTPAFVLTVNPGDTKAIPLIAVLLVPEGFPIRLWNMQVTGDLDQLNRQGSISRAEMKEREGRCGGWECRETLWIYEDRFQAKSVQAGYALLSFPMADSSARTFMIWFREPVVEGLPHHPYVLEVIKGISPRAVNVKEETAN